MSSDNLLEPVYQFRAQTEQLLKLARAGDWEGYEQQAPERQALLAKLNENQFMIDVAEAGLADELREQIADIQALNDELGRLAEQTKSDIANDLKRQNTNDKAVKAYKTP